MIASLVVQIVTGWLRVKALGAKQSNFCLLHRVSYSFSFRTVNPNPSYWALIALMLAADCGSILWSGLTFSALGIAICYTYVVFWD